MSDSEFVLKTAPPRLPRTALVRDRLLRDAERIFDVTALAVVAPAGYGKTTLLLQWRQRWLEQGARVAWISVDAQDDPARFAALFAHALRGIGAIGIEDVAGRNGMDALTAILAAVERRRTRTVVVIDDAERLPEATLAQVLQYLLLNAPAHLHLAIGSRAALPLRTAELLAHQRFHMIPVQDLCLSAQESLEILEARLGDRLDLDARMRLHDAVEGWPIGLQLAIAAIEQEADPVAAVHSLSARRGNLQDYFADSMQAAFSGDTIAALAHLAILDRFDADLGALVCAAPIGELLERLLRETPILIAGEQTGWYRLHPLARDYLLGLFERLPADERAELHARASHWYIGQGHFHEAAAHALAAGDEPLAQAHAARALWALGAGGRVDEAREWLARMPGVLHSPDLQERLAAATVLAFSERNEEGLQLAMAVLADPALPQALALVALRVASSAAAYADRPGLLQTLLADWPQVPLGSADPLYRVNRLNVMCFLALHAGDTTRMRALAEDVAACGDHGSLLLAAAVNRMLLGLGHLWDGNPGQACALLSGHLLQAERQLGRRSMIACLYASVLALAMVELGQPEAVPLLLADRLDMIERAGFPDNILAAYGALTQAALAHGDEAAAMKVLDGLEALSRRRHLPRLQLHVLAQRSRLLALKGCSERVVGQLAALDALAEVFAQPALRPYQPEYRLLAAVAHAHARLGHGELDEAERCLDRAAALAASMHRQRDARGLLVLRAVVARKRGDRGAQAMLLEALNLAALSGNPRLPADSHPLALQMAAELDNVSLLDGRAEDAIAAETDAATPASALLTPKEAEILGLLERGMSNKRIALVLGIGAETVKWHLKNLFSKLSAASREHAVDRARLLGLVG